MNRTYTQREFEQTLFVQLKGGWSKRCSNLFVVLARAKLKPRPKVRCMWGWNFQEPALNTGHFILKDIYFMQLNLNMKFINYYLPSWSFTGPWNVLLNGLADHTLVSVILFGSALRGTWQSKISFVTYLFVETICDSENLSSLVRTSQSQFTSSSSGGNVKSRKSLWVTWFTQLFRLVVSNKWRCFVYRRFYHRWSDTPSIYFKRNFWRYTLYGRISSPSKLWPLFYSWAHFLFLLSFDPAGTPFDGM